MKSHLRSLRLLLFTREMQEASLQLNEATSVEDQATPAGYRHMLSPQGALHLDVQPASQPCTRLGHPLGSTHGRLFSLSFAQGVFNEALRDIPLVPLPKSKEEHIPQALCGRYGKKKCSLFEIPQDQPAVLGWIVSPQIHVHMEPQRVTLFVNSVFVDVIREDEVTWLRLGLNPMTGVFTRREKSGLRRTGKTATCRRRRRLQ